jgi:hypothetical protein
VTRRVIVWGLVLMAVLVAAALVSAVWTRLWSWLPWSAESQLERATAARDVAQAQADARRLERYDQAEQIARVKTDGRVRVEIAAETSAPNAQEPLDPDRAAPLRNHGMAQPW